jgi:hypothetical protein
MFAQSVVHYVVNKVCELPRTVGFGAQKTNQIDKTLKVALLPLWFRYLSRFDDGVLP